MNIECCKIPRPFPHSVRDKLIVLSEQNPTAFTLSIIASRLFKNIFYFPVYQPFRCLVKMDPTDCGKTVLALNQIFLKKQEFKLLRNLIRLRFPLQAVVNHQNYCFFDLFSSAAIVKAYQERKDDSLQTLNQKYLKMFVKIFGNSWQWEI